MKNLQTLRLAVLIGFVILAASGLASAGTVDCSDFSGTIDTRVNSDVNADVNCTIEDGGFVDGNIFADGTTVTVLEGGTVDGNIEQKGDGHIIVLGGVVNGTIKEGDDGGITITNGAVNGNIEESGIGSVNISSDGAPLKINGDIKETGDGDVSIELEADSFSVINGKTLEENDGNLDILVKATCRYKGDANEKGPGDLTTSGDGIFEGNTKEENTGCCSNTIPTDGGIFKGKACDASNICP